MSRAHTLRLFKYADEFQSFKAGDVIFKEGDPGQHMFVIKSGRIELRVGKTVLEDIKQEGILGEMALLDGEKRSATAVAATDCQLVPLDREKFLYLVQETPDFALEVLRIMAWRLRRMDQDRVERKG